MSDEGYKSAICLLFLAIIVVFFASGNAGFGDGKQVIRTEAVERGYAEWVPDKEGNTTFKWKEVAK